MAYEYKEEEGHSILTKTSFLHKFFSQWQQVF